MLCVVRKQHKAKQAEMVLAEHIITRELFAECMLRSVYVFPASCGLLFFFGHLLTF